MQLQYVTSLPCMSYLCLLVGCMEWSGITLMVSDWQVVVKQSILQWVCNNISEGVNVGVNFRCMATVFVWQRRLPNRERWNMVGRAALCSVFSWNPEPICLTYSPAPCSFHIGCLCYKYLSLKWCNVDSHIIIGLVCCNHIVLNDREVFIMHCVQYN